MGSVGMDDATCAALAALNRAFYEDFAGDFAETRRGWLPGFDLILPHIAPAANVLDIGCGNGRLLGFLAARGWSGAYTGMDQSARLLDRARVAASELPGIAACFVEADLLQPGWAAPLPPASAGALACLAVLHHIPGRAQRRRFLSDCAGLLSESGLMVLSTWQFLGAARLRARILLWDTVGLDGGRVEPGDYLLSWGAGAPGRRYCASIDRTALDALAEAAGLRPVAHYMADGREGNLNLYGVYARRSA
jgi:SAM-dependent methyltransferase